MSIRATVAFATLTAMLLAPTAQTVPQDPAALGYLNLHKRHPDADEGPKEFSTYGADQGVRSLDQMSSALRSFYRLTERVRRSIPRAEMKQIGYTDSSMQTIGFHNIPLIVEGSLLKEDYELKQAQYELARLKRDRGIVNQTAVDAAARAYQEATRRFQVFWDTKLPTN